MVSEKRNEARLTPSRTPPQNAQFGNTALGTVGGVDQNYSEPTWERGSTDANQVITAVANGTGEPDLAALANITSISLTFEGYYYNITNGSRNVALLGTSIASPVLAGVINSVDFVMKARGAPILGFINALAFDIGGQSLTASPFFDITEYHNAAYDALAGYDLITGWGVLNAANWTYSDTFKESGLPSGADWSVTFGGTTFSSTTADISPTEFFKSTSYSIPEVTVGYSIYRASPSSGTASLTLGSFHQTIDVTFSFVGILCHGPDCIQ